jgi:excisionase family DNA binding protein
MTTALPTGTLDERLQPVKATRVESRGAIERDSGQPNENIDVLVLPRERHRASTAEREPVASAKDASASAIGWVERYLHQIVRSAVRQELTLLVSSAATVAPGETTEYLTIARAAKIADVHPCTIREWIKSGGLTAYRCGSRGYRIRRADLDTHLTITSAEPTREEINDRVATILAKRRTKHRATRGGDRG